MCPEQFYTTKYSHITLARKTLHWQPTEHHSVLKIALLVYKFLHSDYPKYFVPFLKPRHSRSQANGVVLEVPHFASSVYESTKHFSLSLAYDTQKTGMICLMIYVRPLLSTIQKDVENLSICRSIPTLVSGFVLVFLRGADPSNISGDMIMDFCFSV